MNVAAIVFDEMKGRNVVQDGEDYGADSGKRQEEADGRHEETAVRAVGQAIVDGLAERRAVAQEHQESCYRDR
jgi:hypothetical protein